MATRGSGFKLYGMLRLALAFCVLFPSLAFASSLDAMLDRPDADIKRLFKESTTYRIRTFVSEWHRWPKDSIAAIKRELEPDTDTNLVLVEAPLTFYAAYKGKQFLGLVHGTAFESRIGPMQVFVAYATNGKVRDVYIQKISSAHAPHFRSKYYRTQFRKFSFTRLPEDAHVKPPLRMPTKEVLQDHHALVRAVRINILLVKYYYNRIKE